MGFTRDFWSLIIEFVMTITAVYMRCLGISYPKKFTNDICIMSASSKFIYNESYKKNGE